MWQDWKQTNITQIATALAVGLLALGAFTFPGTAHHHEHPPEPYVVTNEWHGFIECGAGAVVVAVAACSLLDAPNDDFLHQVETGPGIRSVVIGMDWDPVGGISSPELQLYVDVGLQESYIVGGPPPLELRIDDLPADGADLRFRVFVEGAGVVYHQQFAVYHDHFYHAPAPEGYSALPDHADDAEPHVASNTWSGQLDCAIGTPVAQAEPCTALLPGTNGIEVALGPGIETVVLAMDWEPVGGISADELMIQVARESYERISEVSGTPPLELRIDDVDLQGETLRFFVSPKYEPAVVLQQPFTVYHDHFYHAPAPDGYSALPDE